MKKRTCWLYACVLALLIPGCGSNPARTHRGTLLDDKVTTQRVQEAFNRSGRPFSAVHAGTTNGVVVLSGSVASAADRARAEEIARTVKRVKDLRNDLQVVESK